MGREKLAKNAKKHHPGFQRDPQLYTQLVQSLLIFAEWTASSDLIVVWQILISKTLIKALYHTVFLGRKLSENSYKNNNVLNKYMWIMIRWYSIFNKMKINSVMVMNVDIVVCPFFHKLRGINFKIVLTWNYICFFL